MKKAALTFLQVAITAAILWLVFRDPTKRAEMLSALKTADPAWLLAGFLAYGVVELLTGIRWRLLLRVQGVRVGWGRLSQLLMVGVFFNFFIPGGTGGDVVKTFYLLKETPGKGPQALLSVLFDRIIGLFSLVVLAAIFSCWRWDWLTAHPETTRYVWMGLAILGASVAGFAFSFALSGLGWVHRLPPRFPARDKLADLAMAYNQYGREWPTTLMALGISIGVHLAYFTTFYCAGQALAVPGRHLPSLMDMCTVLPVVNTILSMPISFGGIGIREKLFEIFLGNLAGVNNAVAVVISSTGYALTLIWGLVGGLLYIFYRPSEHARLRDINAEVASLAHAVAESEIASEQHPPSP